MSLVSRSIKCHVIPVTEDIEAEEHKCLVIDKFRNQRSDWYMVITEDGDIRNIHPTWVLDVYPEGSDSDDLNAVY